MVIDQDDLTRKDAEEDQGVNFFLHSQPPDAVSNLCQATARLRDSLRHLDGAEISHHALVLRTGHVHIQFPVVVELDTLPQLAQVVGEEVVELAADVQFLRGVQLNPFLLIICLFCRRNRLLVFDVHKAGVRRVAPDMPGGSPISVVRLRVTLIMFWVPLWSHLVIK